MRAVRYVAAFVALFAAVSCQAESSFDPLALEPADFSREFEARFQYGPPQPGPAETGDQAQGQLLDAQYFLGFPDHDRSYPPEARARARELAGALVADATRLNHEEFVLRVAEIAALADNAHTAIGENAFRKNTPRIALRTYPFADGVYVLRAPVALRELLGARIDQIDGRSIDEIRQVLSRYAGGTAAWRHRITHAILESPGLLRAAGIAGDPMALELSGLLADGTPFRRRLEAEIRGRDAPVSSLARLVFPLAETVDATQASLLRESGTLPVWLRQRTKLFVLDAIEGGGLYAAFGHNADGDEEPIGAFLQSVLDAVKAQRPGFMVIDFRMNGGGDFTTTYDFAGEIVRVTGDAPIYVITSPFTFSAAITTLGAIKQAGGDRVKIVGEEVGDRLDFYAESGGAYHLPNSFINVNFATGRYTYDRPCTDTETCSWLIYKYPVLVENLVPDLAAPLTFSAYSAGRDPAMDAIMRDMSRSAE